MSDQPPPYAPPPPEGYGAPQPRGERPAAVRTAVNLIWVTIALSVLTTILTVFMLDTLVDTALETADTAGVGADTLRTGVIVGAVVWLVLSVGVSVLLAVFIGKGRSWARIVYTVLGGIGILLTLLGLVTGGAPVLFVLLDVLSAALIAAVIFLLWKPESSAWFTGRG